MTALEEKIANHILDLEAEQERLGAQIELLRGLLLEHEAAEEGDEGNADGAERPRPSPRPKKPSADGNGKPKARHRIREVLLQSGPLRILDIAEKLGIKDVTVCAALKNSPWFQRVDPSNRLSPWQLTPAGTTGETT